MTEIKKIFFKHHYFKLDSLVFPTVRGKSWINVQTDDTVLVIDKKLNLEYEVVVLENRLMQIEDLSYAFIRWDGTYADELGIHVIKDHHDFVDLLNSFRRFNKIKSIEEEVCVLWLLKEK